MYAHLSLFEKKTIQKRPLFPIFKKFSSIHKNNSALIASIVLKKIYSHGICALSRKQFHAFFCVRSKSQILRVKNVKKTNLTHPKAAKLATLKFALNNVIVVRCNLLSLLSKFACISCPSITSSTASCLSETAKLYFLAFTAS